MGFSTLIDIIGSVIIGGIILLMIGRVNNNITENTFDNNSDYSSLASMTSVALALESDIRKIGYCSKWDTVMNISQSIILADSNKIKFVYDTKNDGTGKMDTVYYYVNNTSELSSTSNPDDRYYYKQINNLAPVRVSAVNIFRFNYFDSLGDEISFPITGLKLREINSIEMSVSIEPGEKLLSAARANEPYPPSYWRETRVTSRNLFNR